MRLRPPVGVAAPLAAVRLDVGPGTAALLHGAGDTLVVGVGLLPRPLQIKVHVDAIVVLLEARVVGIRGPGERDCAWVGCVARVDAIEKVEIATALGNERPVSYLLNVTDFWYQFSCATYVLLHVINYTLAPTLGVLTVSSLAIFAIRKSREALLYIPRAGDRDSHLDALPPVPMTLASLVVTRDAVIMSKLAVLCHELVSEVRSDVAWHVGYPGTGRVVHGREV